MKTELLYLFVISIYGGGDLARRVGGWVFCPKWDLVDYRWVLLSDADNIIIYLFIFVYSLFIF